MSCRPRGQITQGRVPGDQIIFARERWFLKSLDDSSSLSIYPSKAFIFDAVILQRTWPTSGKKVIGKEVVNKVWGRVSNQEEANEKGRKQSDMQAANLIRQAHYKTTSIHLGNLGPKRNFYFPNLFGERRRGWWPFSITSINIKKPNPTSHNDHVLKMTTQILERCPVTFVGVDLDKKIHIRLFWKHERHSATSLDWSWGSDIVTNHPVAVSILAPKNCPSGGVWMPWRNKLWLTSSAFPCCNIWQQDSSIKDMYCWVTRRNAASSSKCWRKRPKQPWPEGTHHSLYPSCTQPLQSLNLIQTSKDPQLSVPKLLPGKAPQESRECN